MRAWARGKKRKRKEKKRNAHNNSALKKPWEKKQQRRSVNSRFVRLSPRKARVDDFFLLFFFFFLFFFSLRKTKRSVRKRRERERERVRERKRYVGKRTSVNKRWKKKKKKRKVQCEEFTRRAAADVLLRRPPQPLYAPCSTVDAEKYVSYRCRREIRHRTEEKKRHTKEM